jgi:hypothetical protein
MALLLVGVFARCRDQSPDVTPAAIVIASAAPTLVSGATMTLSATVSNAGGGALQGQTIAWSSSDATIATVSPAGEVTAARAGEARITASVGLIHSSPTAITVTPGAASQLAIRTQPLGASSGAALTTQPVIEVRDAAGNLVTTATPTITATIATGGGIVSGSTATAEGGVATFRTIAVSGTVGDHTLSFSASGLASATSAGFALGAGAPAKLVMRVEPTGAASGSPFRTQPEILICDEAGNLAQTSNATVTASIAVGGGLATGITSIAVGGVATFSALGIIGEVGAHTIAFSAAGLTSVNSASFMLSPGVATALRIRVQPGGALSGQPFISVPVVEVVDGGGNMASSSSVVVTATIASGGGSLTAATATTVDGVATFAGLTLAGAVGPHTVIFSADGLLAATSAVFTLGAGTPTQLVIVVQPSGGSSGSPLSRQPVVAATDGAGNVTPSIGGTVTATIASGGGSVANNSATLSSGIASFQSLAVTAPPGGVTLVFQSGNLQPVISAAITILAGPPARLAIRVAPPSFVPNGVPMNPQPVILVLDASGNPSPVPVVVTMTTNATSGTITNATATAVNGVATFSGLTLSGPQGARDYTFFVLGLSSLGPFRITLSQ